MLAGLLGWLGIAAGGMPGGAIKLTDRGSRSRGGMPGKLRAPGWKAKRRRKGKLAREARRLNRDPS